MGSAGDPDLSARDKKLVDDINSLPPDGWNNTSEETPRINSFKKPGITITAIPVSEEIRKSLNTGGAKLPPLVHKQEVWTSWSFKFEYKLQDAWLGVFWKNNENSDEKHLLQYKVEKLDVWICLIPCLPIHITRKKVKL